MITDNKNTTPAPALSAQAGDEPKAGEVWKFPMNSTHTGRTVWWTRKIKEVYGCEGERWCCWEEPRPDHSGCVPVEVVMEGKLISPAGSGIKDRILKLQNDKCNAGLMGDLDDARAYEKQIKELELKKSLPNVEVRHGGPDGNE